MNARRATTLALAAAAVAGLGCVDVSWARAPQLVLADSTLVVAALDTTVPVTATAAGVAIDPSEVTFSRVSEARYLANGPVLDTAKLAAGSLVTRYPGEVVVSVAAPDTRQTTLRIIVAPSTPVILDVAVPAIVGPDSVVTLRGYRLHDPNVVASVRGRAAHVIHRDSANLTVRPFQMDTTMVACDTPARAPLDLAGAVLRDDVAAPELRFERPGELAIAPGEAIFLTRQQMEGCVMLPAPAPDTERTLYAFVTVDTAWTLPQHEWTAPYAAPGSVTVAVTRLSDPVAGTPRIPSLPFGAGSVASFASIADEVAGRTRPPVDSTTAGFGYMYRDVPLAIADTFTTVLTDLGAVQAPRPAKVLDVVGDYVVVAAWTDLGDAELDALDARLPMVREAIEIFLERADGMYQDVFGVGRPRTLRKHEQVVLMIESETANASAQQLMVIPIGDGPRSELEGFYLTLAHEIAHLYHFAHRDLAEGRHHGGPAGGRPSLWKAWNIEGIADYMMAHAGAAYRGLSYLPEKAPVYEDFIYRGLQGGGSWSCGYSGMAALLRRFDAALIESGAEPAEARRRVVRAAIAGWGTGLADDPGETDTCGLHCLLKQAYGETTIGDVLMRLYLDDLVADAFPHPVYTNPTTFNPLGLFAGQSRDGRTWESNVRPSGAGVNITLPDVDGGAYRLTQGRDNDSERWAVFRIPHDALPHR